MAKPVIVSIEKNFVDILRRKLELAKPNATQSEIHVELMKLMKQQFLAIQQYENSPGHPDVAPVEFVGTSTENLYQCLAGEAQDPNDEDLDSNVSMEDFWDAMIDATRIVTERKQRAALCLQTKEVGSGLAHQSNP